jgi:hypothetical protein
MHNVETVAELFALADKCAREAKAQSHTERRSALDEPASPERSRLGNKKNKRKSIAALATEGRNKPPTRKKHVGAPKSWPQQSREPTSGTRSTGPIDTTSPSASWSRASRRTTRRSGEIDAMVTAIEMPRVAIPTS